MDMHSGGGSKEKFDFLHIEAPSDEACVIFFNRFGHNPERVSCTCCGDDYSISEDDSLEQSSAYDRGCAYDRESDSYVEHGDPSRKYRPYQTLKEYLGRKDVSVIYAKDIKPEERKGDVPQQGYVWQ
jgi:hypothetical protein